MEDAFFKQEQEKAVLDMLDRMMKAGRDIKAIKQTAAPANTAGVLPQVMAQQLRLERPRRAEERRVQQFYKFQKGNRPLWSPPAMSVLHSPMYVDKATLGSSVSLGRAKWNAGHTTVEGASIFDVKKGVNLASGDGAPAAAAGPIEALPKYKQAKLPVPQVADIMGVKFRLLPEYTPGRALVWGSILALWGTSVVVMRSARALDITSIDDANSKLSVALKPVVSTFQTNFTPLKDKVETIKPSKDNAAGFELVERLKNKLKPAA